MVKSKRSSSGCTSVKVEVSVTISSNFGCAAMPNKCNIFILNYLDNVVSIVNRIVFIWSVIYWRITIMLRCRDASIAYISVTFAGYMLIPLTKVPLIIDIDWLGRTILGGCKLNLLAC